MKATTKFTKGLAILSKLTQTDYVDCAAYSAARGLIGSAPQQWDELPAPTAAPQTGPLRLKLKSRPEQPRMASALFALATVVILPIALAVAIAAVMSE